MIKRKAIELKI